MKVRLETCARVVEIAGAIAVVMSVIYLAVQISDNTRLLRSQAHSSALSLMQRPLEIMLENESLAHIVSQCNARPAEVSEEHWERCLNYYFMQFNGWEYIYYQNRDGSIPKELWVGADNNFKNRVQTKPGYLRFWNEMALAFDEPFRSYVSAEFRKAAHK